MKKTLLIIACIWFCTSSWSQAPTLQWQKCYGGTSFDGLFCIQNTNDGGYIIVGDAASNDGLISLNHGQIDALVIKIDATGNVEWQKCYGGTSNDMFYSVHPTADGGYIMVGDTYSNDGDVVGNHGDYDGWVVKINSIGTIEWQKCLGGTSLEELWSVQTTADGGYIMAGESHSNDGTVSGNHGNTDAWIVKLNSTGNLQWQKSYGGTNYDNVKSIKLTAVFANKVIRDLFESEYC